MKTFISLGLIFAGTAVLAHSGVQNPDVMPRMMTLSERATREATLTSGLAGGVEPGTDPRSVVQQVGRASCACHSEVYK